MRRLLAAFSLTLIPFFLYAWPKLTFENYFNDHTMRIDYFHTGNATEEIFTIDQIYTYGIWAGNPHHSLDQFNNGKYYVHIIDVASNQLIYSRGYNTYFAEYQTTRPAIEGRKKTYHESVLIPEPKAPFLFVIEVRDKQNVLRPKFIRKIDPGDWHIIREQPGARAQIITVLKNGPAHSKVDIVFLSEGYTQDEFKLFKKDLKERADLFFSVEPYRSNRNRFNLYGVFRPSQQSGVDEPGKQVYRNTILNASYNALGLSRYLLTEDNRSVRDMAGQVPYDAIFIMVNSKRYGGGGIYNQYAVFTAHSPATELVFVHEFGHSFAGLADEYYNSEVAYTDFYPKGVEPTEPNITALLDPHRLKWVNEVNPGKAVPTYWNKNEYDKLSVHRQSLRRRLHRLQLSGDSLKVQNQLKTDMAELEKKLKTFIADHPLKNKVGFFEGAGYSSHGLYRPQLNCMMFSNREKKFCAVCRSAIQRMIYFYSR